MKDTYCMIKEGSRNIVGYAYVFGDYFQVKDKVIPH